MLSDPPDRSAGNTNVATMRGHQHSCVVECFGMLEHEAHDWWTLLSCEASPEKNNGL